jgi:predicted Zn-ribbon and HTH transcriptional regulator
VSTQSRTISVGDADEMVPLAMAQPISAHLLCSVLDSLGIKAVVVGEYSAAVVTFFSAVGTTAVHVRRGDYDTAVAKLAQFLEEAGRLNAATITRCLACGYDMTGLEKQERCPECGTSWSALAKLKNTITLAPPPRPPGQESTVQKIGVAMGMAIVIGVIVLIVAGVLAVWGFYGE